VGSRYNPETGDVVVGRITEVGMSHNYLMNSASTNKGQQEQTFLCSLQIIVVFVVDIFSLCDSMDRKLDMIF
jgi:exosome complex RNA-binding protein Rrp4